MRLTAEDLSEAAVMLAVKNEKLRIELTDELQLIARNYWEQHRDEERPSPDWYRKKVARIQKAAENLLNLLRESKGTALAHLRVWTKLHMDRPLLRGFVEEPLSVEQLLNDFVAVCESCRFKAPPKGAPVKGSIKVSVAELRDVWTRFTETKFPLNLEAADNRRDHGGQPVAERGHAYEFVSPGPRFVQVMMQRIDPSVTIASIKTALREAHVKARRVH